MVIGHPAAVGRMVAQDASDVGRKPHVAFGSLVCRTDDAVAGLPSQYDPVLLAVIGIDSGHGRHPYASYPVPEDIFDARIHQSLA